MSNIRDYFRSKALNIRELFNETGQDILFDRYFITKTMDV